MSSRGIVVAIRYRALAGREQAARAALAELVATVLAEEGACGGIRMLVDADDPASILLVEEWPDRASYLGPHFETPHLQAFIARAGAICVTGTHFSAPGPAAAQRKAIRLAKAHGAKVVFDIDYRPNLWGLAGHAAGFERFVASDRVTREYQSILADTDLVVGTEEEVAIAAGTSDLPSALRVIRSFTDATIVLKRGAKGCIVYDGAIPDDLEDGIVGQGFPIEVYNVLGAGDAFMSGFLRGWLRGEPHAISATWANACGAFAVSRLLCAPEYPTWPELTHFLEQGSGERALRKDETLNHIHHATTRRMQWPTLRSVTPLPKVACRTSSSGKVPWRPTWC